MHIKKIWVTEKYVAFMYLVCSTPVVPSPCWLTDNSE